MGDHPRTLRLPARGFTMIELVSVMALIGILAAIAISRLDVDAFRQRGFHDALKSGLQFARKAAIAKRRQVCVNLAGTGVVSLTLATATPEGGITACPTGTPLNLPIRDSNCSNGNEICPPAGVTVTGGTLYFDALGRASAATTFTSTGQANIVVEQETGYVH